MNGNGFNFNAPRGSLPEHNHPRFSFQVDYGPPADGGVAPPVSQLKAIRMQERPSLASVAEGSEDPSEDAESDFSLTPPSSQESGFSLSQASSSTVSGDVHTTETHLTGPSAAPAPTQPTQAFRPVVRTRTLRKEDTLMSVDAPSVADEVEMRMLPILQTMCGKMCNEICARQAQGAAEIHAAIRQAYLQTQSEVLDLKKQVVELRLQLERLGNGYQ
ncbi:hypothetical protein C8T65DRAFT_737468 [Cerioporus squamosus]|nr:hypothetical protein C8T65DRAFT_737468 [Cerioporus squamosus]